MTHDELLAEIDQWLFHSAMARVPSNKALNVLKALRAVVELCAVQDEVTVGDKGIFNSGRNSMRTEIIQAIEKELK